MHQMVISGWSTDSVHRRRRNRMWIGLCVVLFISVLLTVILAILLPRLNEVVPGREECLAVTKDADRFDCHPDRPITRESCESRGCCFRPASDLDVTDNDLIISRYLGVPSCFHPVIPDFRYKLDFHLHSERNHLKAIFLKTKPSGFPRDVEGVQLTVVPIDDYGLRIQVKDKNATRFEPEVPISYKSTGNRDSHTYSVSLNDFGETLSVIRKKSGQIVFQVDFNTLIYSEFFLQLSTTVASKYVYGLGEQKENILKSNFNWQRYTIFNQGDLPVPNRNLYGSHPFFLVMDPSHGESYGVFLLNSNAMDYVLQPTPAITFRTVGGILDFFLFLGPSPADVVSQYTSLFGPPNFPPRWSLGFQLCRYGYFTLNKTKEVLKRNLDAGIPVDVQWHDIDYMENYLSFTFDPVNFKGLPEFVDELHKDGRHYVAMISPGVSNIEAPGTYPPYDDAEKLDLFIKQAMSGRPIEGKVWNKNYTVFPDFSNPKTTEYWKKLFEHFHKKLKFDGIWLDMNEPLNFFNGSAPGYECPDMIFDNPPYVPGRPYPLKTLTLCMSSDHHQTKHYNEHNLVAFREAKATHEAMKKITGKRPFIISRASFSGQGIYSGHWSGDITSNWEDMRYSISAMLAFSLYGMPMTGSDICGFRLNTTEELCARWHSLGAFYPFSRNHNDYDALDQDPAALNRSTVVESAKYALKIRYYFLPYLYTLFYKNYIKGETVARPLFFEFPDDVETYAVEEQFLWGPAFHIMPALYPGVKNITPYVPVGVWYDLSGKQYRSSGERMNFPAELTSINILLRGGYIFPAQEPGKTTIESALNPFDIVVALDNETKAQGELFWDDGETLDTVENGVYNLIKMSADMNGMKISSEKRSYGSQMNLRNIKVYGLKEKPKYVSINGKEVTYTFENQLLIDASGYSLLDELTVKWN